MSGKWVQVKDANWKVPYIGGWCEGYVSMAWGYSKFFKDKNGNVAGTESNGKGKTSYASATAHWKAKKGNHTGQPPKGITVPVFFSLGSTPNGHVAIRLDDMYVASSTLSGYNKQGYLHKNIDDLIKMYAKYNKSCKYLGWSEYVGGVQVVKWVEDKPKPTPKPTEPAKPVENPVEKVPQTPPEAPTESEPEKPVPTPVEPEKPTEKPVETQVTPEVPLETVETPRQTLQQALGSIIAIIATLIAALLAGISLSK